jgi:hypothetical protein
LARYRNYQLRLIIERSYASAERLQELVPFVKNGQNVETAMKKAVNGIQYLKLHGCIDHYMDRDIPFILNSEQYARYFKNRTRMLDRFRDWGTEFPIIFCGYSMSDPHFQSILFDLFDMQQQRQMYYVVDPEIDPIEERYLASQRITPIRTTLKEFLVLLDAAISTISRSLPKSIGGGTSTLRRHYKVANAPESDALFQFLSDDVEHIRRGLPVAAVDPKDFYRGLDNGWGGIGQVLDVSRSITDSLVVDAILASDNERPTKVDLYAVKGPAGNGKTIVLKRAAWMAAHDYDKIVLFVKMGGAIRNDVLEEIYRYTQERIFLFIDKAALYVEDIRRLIEFAKSRDLRLTIIVAEREAEWNVRCESLEKYAIREFSVRYLSEREIRALLRTLESHDSLGLLKELSDFEDRVKRLMAGAQRQLLVALHEATLGKAFEDIVFEEYHRIIPNEAQALYLDICTLYRLGVSVRAGLISRVSGINFVDFDRRLFRPLAHIVRSYFDKYIGDYVYTARHQHVAEMVFERVLAEPERRYDQIVRIMGGMNLDYSSDRSAFSQLVRGHWVAEALRSRELGRSFFEAAARVAPNEGFLLQQRGIYEMEHGGDLLLAQKYLDQGQSLEPHNRLIQHSLAVLARRQALATDNSLLRSAIVIEPEPW